MGFHTCEYCDNDSKSQHRSTSSSDNWIKSPGYNVTYQVPDMILHYVVHHGYVPSTEFIKNIMKNSVDELAGNSSDQWAQNIKKVGYLSGPFPKPPTRNVSNSSGGLGALMRQSAS